MTSLIVLALLRFSSRAFYVSPTGSDANDGRSWSQAWRTVSRVSKEQLKAGDHIVLESGGTFYGSFDFLTGGTPSEPVVLRSEGKAATLVSTDKPAITIRAGGITIENLNLKGGAISKGKDHEGVLLAAPKGHRSRQVRLDHLDVSGFGGQGVSITAEKESLDGFDDVQIMHTRVHGNYDTGISSEDGVAFLKKGFAHRNILISDCDVSDNLGGNGIVLSGVDGAIVEFCRASRNHSEGGALGMWAWCAHRTLFRYCIADGTRGKSDAGGFDLDGGTTECIVEHCLSYDNDGPGYMHCDYPFAPRTEKNVVRHSISFNDGRRPGGAAVGFGFVVWGSGLYNCVIENNLAILTKTDPQKRNNGVLFAAFIRDDKEKISDQRLDGAVFRHNKVEIDGFGSAFVRNDFPNRYPQDLVFLNNRYRSTNNPPFIEGAKGEHRYATLSGWRTATGNDRGNDVETLPYEKLGDVTRLAPRDLPKVFRMLGL